MRALLAALLLVAPLSGCAEGGDVRAALVPYPKVGDVAVYEASGALLELGRWENGAPFVADPARVRLALAPGGTALDGARHPHETFRVTTSLSEGGPFVERSTRFVSPIHQAIVQSHYPLSQDQSVVAFDERGYPWLWGASVLFGEELREGASFPLRMQDNLGRGDEIALAWRVEAREEDGSWRLDLQGNASVEATLWMEPASSWPIRVELTVKDDGLSPHVRVHAALPATISARRVELAPGTGEIAPRNRDASFAGDEAVARLAWDGEKPPDGVEDEIPYLLSDAVRDAKLLDAGLRAWLEGADEPRVYRATFKHVPVTAGPAGNVSDQRAPYWLVQFVEKGGRYYEVEVERVQLATPVPLPSGAQGVPRVARSGPAEAPADENHGWFARDAVAEDLVPLSEGVRVVRDVFGAKGIEIFLRSFLDPPGYAYYIDGGFEAEGRYTAVYNPTTGFLEQATGHVEPRVS